MTAGLVACEAVAAGIAAWGFTYAITHAAPVLAAANLLVLAFALFSGISAVAS